MNAPAELHVTASAAEFSAWAAEQLTDPQVMQVDIHDALMIWATARAIWNAHPELRDALSEQTPSCVRRAMTDLGMFMGCRYLCAQIGLDADEGEQLMTGLFGKSVPELEI